jgi:hypothetical protein
MNRTLEDEIRGALREGAANEDTCTEWARVALSQNAPLRRRPIRPLWPAMAAAVFLAVVFWPHAESPTQEIPADGDTHKEKVAQDTSVEDQRKANLAFLEKEGDKRLMTDGRWVVVAGGDTFYVADTAKEAIALATKMAPNVRHRFVFCRGAKEYHRGDVIADRGPVTLERVGIRFFQRTGLDAKDHKSVKLTINGRAIPFRSVPKSMAPILLPRDMQFPKFEIPGRMILEDMDRNWRSFRRYLVRVQCDKPKLDLWTEAIGSAEGTDVAPGDWVGVRLGNHVFHALLSPAPEIAAKEGKQVLVLHFKKGSSEYLHSLFDDTYLRGAAQYAVPNATDTALWRYKKDGRLVEILQLPDGSEKTRRRLRTFLAAR